jgi:aminoglycoside phosphotransferase (APT) family kinase protein
MADAGTARLTAALAGAGVSWDQVADWRSLTGGTFNAVYLVGLADGTGLVVKIPPGPDTPLLSYEQGILGTEALYYQLAGQCRDVTVPAVVTVDATGAAGGYLVMTQCPGSPWPELTPPPSGAERAELRAELGRQVARVHTITGTGFGYPSLAVGPLRGSWRAAFLDMVNAVLADAARFAVTLPRPADGIRDWFTARAAVLDEVTTPVLVHFDLWDGNILVESGPTGRRIGALIDAERAFWGDPLAEFISLALFADIEQDTAFLQGYRAAGGTATFDLAARLRLSLYQAYLYLIMWVEAVPRQASRERGGWLFDRVFRPLAAALDDGAAPGGGGQAGIVADLRLVRERGAGLAGGDRARQYPEGGPQRALRDDREDARVPPVLLDRGPVVVGRHQRPLLDRRQPVAVNVADVPLAADGPGDLPVRLERDDLHGDVVKAEGVVVERFAVHVHHERVSHLADDVAACLHQHAGAVDRDVPARITEHGKDLGRGRGHRPLHFESFRHAPIVARRLAPSPPAPGGGARTADTANRGSRTGRQDRPPGKISI